MLFFKKRHKPTKISKKEQEYRKLQIEAEQKRWEKEDNIDKKIKLHPHFSKCWPEYKFAVYWETEDPNGILNEERAKAWAKENGCYNYRFKFKTKESGKYMYNNPHYLYSSDPDDREYYKTHLSWCETLGGPTIKGKYCEALVFFDDPKLSEKFRCVRSDIFQEHGHIDGYEYKYNIYLHEKNENRGLFPIEETYFDNLLRRAEFVANYQLQEENGTANQPTGIFYEYSRKYNYEKEDWDILTYELLDQDIDKYVYQLDVIVDPNTGERWPSPGVKDKVNEYLKTRVPITDRYQRYRDRIMMPWFQWDEERKDIKDDKDLDLS